MKERNSWMIYLTIFVVSLMGVMMIRAPQVEGATIGSEVPGYNNRDKNARIRDIFKDINFAKGIVNEFNSPVNRNFTLDTRVTQKMLNDINKTITMNPDGSVNGPNLSLPGGVSSLEGIQYLNNVQGFSFEPAPTANDSPQGNYYDNTFTDLTPLTKLDAGSKVKQLLMGNSNVSDISVLSNPIFSEMLELNLSKAEGTTKPKISNISGLSGLSKLWKLGIQFNNVSDLTPLMNKPNLQQLFMRSNQITNLDALATSPNLVSVYVEDNYSLYSIAGMKNHDKLLNFSIMRNGLIDTLEPLRQAANIKQLWFSGNKINTLEPLRGHTKLNTLIMDTNNLYDLSPLVGNKIANMTGQGMFTKNQTVVLDPVVKYSRLVPLIIDNPVKWLDGNALGTVDTASATISANPAIGIPAPRKNGSKLIWDDPTGFTQLGFKWSYSWLNPVTPPKGSEWMKNGRFDGSLSQPAEETAMARLTITNKILNAPDPNLVLTYEVKLQANLGTRNETGEILKDDKGQPIIDPETGKAYEVPPYIKVDTILANVDDGAKGKITKKDETTAVISLKNGESISLPAIPDGTYSVTQNYDSNGINAQYKQNDPSSPGNLVNYKGPVTGNIFPTAVQPEQSLNQLDFVNTFKADKLVITNKDISAFPLQKDFEYQIKFDWPGNPGGVMTGYRTKDDLLISEDNVPDGNQVQIIETVTIPVDGQSHRVKVNDGEKLFFPKNIAYTMTVTVSQKKYTYYHTSVGINEAASPNPPTGQQTDPGPIKMKDPGFKFNFINEANYTPPATGVDEGSHSQPLLMIAMLLSTAALSGYLIQLRRKRNY